MERTAYDNARWRELPRSRCLIDVLFGDVAGACSGLIHRHHVNPDDPWSRTFECCAGHHPKIHAALRVLTENADREWRRCTHAHPYPEGRAECERKLNGLQAAA